MTSTEPELDGIAVVGIACRFPGAPDLAAFWRNLAAGTESVTFLSAEEMIAAGADPDQVRDPAYVPAAPLLEDMDGFDAALFGCTAREAELLDPQHRLFLELAHHALEDAGCDPARYAGDIGVFGGVGSNRYGWLSLRNNPDVYASAGELAVTTASHTDYLATRVSYKLDLHGPSLTVVTACSTSLVAIHLACESLRSGECDMALAGGSQVEMPYGVGYLHIEGGIESSDGHCRAFDARADGTIWGSGGGVLALRRLGDALAGGDHVYAVIRGTAINNDGADKAGFSAPSMQGQAEVVTQALAVAGVDPGTVGMIEAHGTGTAIGDPIEVGALNQVFTRGTWRPRSCAIGSVKTNIGHLAAAAGVAGLVKAVLALRHRAIPPSLHYETPNPRIDFDGGPFFVCSSLTPWETAGRPRRAGVSSFGIGGTNAHAVLEEAPAREPSGPSREWQVLALSAGRPAALDAAADRLAEHLDRHPELPLPDVAYTLQVGRGRHPYRRALICRAGEAAGRLRSAGGRPRQQAPAAGAAPPVAFLFPGQGAQHVGMGRELYEREPGFRAAVDRCAALLRPPLGFDLREVLHPSPERREEAERRLVQTAVTQPALFTVEYALAELLRGWGVEPGAALGHSVGEYVAACLAGVFSLEEALRLVALRGELMQSLAPGAMLAVTMDAGELAPTLPPGVSVAALNAPGLCVASGPPDAVGTLAEALAEQDVSTTRLRTSHAFHSPMMEPVLDRFRQAVRDAAPRPPRVPFVSNVTGTWIEEAEAADPAYWARHLRQPVQFDAGVRTLLAGGHVLVEVGPGRTLSALVRMQPDAGQGCVGCLPRPRDDGSEQQAVLEALAGLWSRGVDVDWERFHAGEERRRLPLPGHPMDRQRYWIDMVRPDARPARRRSRGRLPLDHWFSVPAWREAPLPPPALPGARAGGAWLVFEDAGWLAADLRGRLEERGQQVVTVREGTGFARAGAAFEVRPDRPEDYDALVGALVEEELVPSTVVHAWCVGAPPARLDLSAEAVRGDQEAGFLSLLLLAQALAARDVRAPLRLVAVTSDAQEVTGGDLRRPGRATVAGVCRVLPVEAPHVRCRHLDLVLPAPGGRAWAALLDQVLAELTGPAEDEVVALRRGRRWVLAHEPVALPPAPVPGGGMRERGVYLITGGLGGIGLTLAAELARRCRARLALTARTPLPERAGWPAWLAEHGPAGRVSRQIRAIEDLELAGAEVLVLAADVADQSAMAGVRAAMLDRFGELHGIVHAAGVPGGGLIEVKTAEQAAGVMAPKVTGGRVLAEVFGDLDLDFVSLCSSITAVAGGYGQADYCGANAFLDALAHSAAFGEVPVVSVNWTAWREAGMAVETAAPDAFRQLRGGGRRRELDHPLLDRLEEADGGQAVLTGRLAPATHWVLAEHRVGGEPVLPGTGYLELARAAFEAAEGAGPVELRDVDFELPLAVPEDGHREVRVVLDRADGVAEFHVASRDGGGGEWREHARGTVARGEAGPAPVHDLEAVLARCATEVAPPTPGLVSFGPRWSSLRWVRHGEGEAVALLEAGETVAAELGRLALHPALLDQATTFGDPERLGLSGTFLPLGWGRLRLRAPLPARLYSHLRRGRAGSDGVVEWDLVLMDEAGREVAEVTDFQIRRAEQAAVAAAVAAPAVAGPAAEARGIGLREGADAFRRLVAWRPGPQVVVSDVELAAVVEDARRLTAERVEEGLEATPQAAAEGSRTVDTPYVAPRTDVERQLGALWGELLGAGQVGVDDDFFALGGNSLVAVQLISRIRAKLGVKLPMRSLFRAPTVAALAGVVEEVGSGRTAAEEPDLVPIPR